MRGEDANWRSRGRSHTCDPSCRPDSPHLCAPSAAGGQPCASQLPFPWGRFCDPFSPSPPSLVLSPPAFSCWLVISCSGPRLDSLSINLFCLPNPVLSLSLDCEAPESRGLVLSRPPPGSGPLSPAQTVTKPNYLLLGPQPALTNSSSSHPNCSKEAWICIPTLLVPFHLDLSLGPGLGAGQSLVMFTPQ